MERISGSILPFTKLENKCGKRTGNSSSTPVPASFVAIGIFHVQVAKVPFSRTRIEAKTKIRKKKKKKKKEKSKKETREILAAGYQPPSQQQLVPACNDCPQRPTLYHATCVLHVSAACPDSHNFVRLGQSHGFTLVLRLRSNASAMPRSAHVPSWTASGGLSGTGTSGALSTFSFLTRPTRILFTRPSASSRHHPAGRCFSIPPPPSPTPTPFPAPSLPSSLILS